MPSPSEGVAAVSSTKKKLPPGAAAAKEDAVVCVVCEQEPPVSAGELADSAALEYLRSIKEKIPSAPVSKSQLSRTSCARCSKSFACRTALFSHIKTAGHAVLTIRPRDNISFGDDIELETAAMDFLRWLVAVPDESTRATEFVEEGDDKVDSRILDAILDSGESMLTVIIARILCLPAHGASRGYLMSLVQRLLPEGNAAAAAVVWQCASSFESMSMPTKTNPGAGWGMSAAAAAATPNSAPVSRPRSMFGLPTVLSELSPIALARRDAQKQGGVTVLLKALLPPGFDCEESCVCCADKTYMCCGSMGALARVSSCGCVACPESMSSWLSTQVNDGQRGTGELACPGCPRLLISQTEIERLTTPTVAARAETLALEKALVCMGDWRWCPAGCGAGGFFTGVGLFEGCMEVYCPGCDMGACAKCNLPTHHHRAPSGRWRSCAEAALERDAASATAAWLEASAKRCPSMYGGCGALTERDGGCSHISCKVCKFEWCWLCEGKYRGRYTMGSVCPC